MTYDAYSPLGARAAWARANQRDVLSSRRTDEYLFRYTLLTTCLFCVRDGLTAAFRYLLDILHLSIVWFVPDGMAFVCLAGFILTACIRDKQPAAILIVLAFGFSILMSIVFFSGDLIVVFSSIKMFMPMIVGFCFRGRSFFEWRYAKLFIGVVFVISVMGVIINPYIQYPWTNFSTTDAFGLTRTAQKLWWAGGETRFGGFAGDSTMAAFMILFSYVMLSRQMSLLVNLICWPLCHWALQVTTSKTALGLFVVYIGVYLALRAVPRRRSLALARVLTAVSFICILVPPLLMLSVSGVDLGAFDSRLSSLADRINNTWGGPFLIISDIFPPGLFTGCGLGCYAYPMKYSSLVDYFLPLDSFYLATFLQMGYPFLAFVILMFFYIKRTLDPIKLLLLLTWNIYSVTVQGYGPSYATLVFGYAVSEIFVAQKRRRDAISIGHGERLIENVDRQRKAEDASW